MQTEHTQLIRGLGLIAAISVNVGNIIGTGVFLKARVMTCNVGSPEKALIVWVVAGLLSMAGALTYAELLAMKPRAAGEYGIMRDAYGRPLGFIYGWTQFSDRAHRFSSRAGCGLCDLSQRPDSAAGLKHSYFEYTLPWRARSFIWSSATRRARSDHHHDTHQLRGGTRERRCCSRAHG